MTVRPQLRPAVPHPDRVISSPLRPSPCCKIFTRDCRKQRGDQGAMEFPWTTLSLIGFAWLEGNREPPGRLKKDLATPSPTDMSLPSVFAEPCVIARRPSERASGQVLGLLDSFVDAPFWPHPKGRQNLFKSAIPGSPEPRDHLDTSSAPCVKSDVLCGGDDPELRSKTIPDSSPLHLVQPVTLF